jgi:hypothetical protein
MNSSTQTILLVLILIAASTAAIAPFAQPSGGGDTAKLEADIAALNADVDALAAQVTANQTVLLARNDTTIEKIDGITTLIFNNQTANAEAFVNAGLNMTTANSVINQKLDSLLDLHSGTPPPNPPDSYANLVEWDYEHTDDGLGPITGFNIQRSSDGGTIWTDYVQVPGADTRSYTDRPLSLGTSYCYRVIALRVREGGAVIDYSVTPSNVACRISPTS